MTLQELQRDPRVLEVQHDHDGIYEVDLRTGFLFEGQRSYSRGTLTDLGDDMKQVLSIPAADYAHWKRHSA